MTKGELIRELENVDDAIDIYVIVSLNKTSGVNDLSMDYRQSFTKLQVTRIVVEQFSATLLIPVIEI